MDSLVGLRAGREGESSTSKTRPLRGDTIIKMAFFGKCETKVEGCVVQPGVLSERLERSKGAP